ncbi:hypothetical protein AC579_1501 [Pseudocercospora musae]|uniref:Zn(2)-C6 fungal-type domain-containing protein n=1 Tax=Pseudocercospora musae TaxID=113226 RepID=A0A139IK88_9PEZI|nr:hypothetical protein AC579_1501 [Pseudocercospora musae]
MPSPACDQCFRRKHPCLGGRPSCEQCLKNGLICTYSTGRPVGKPKGHKKRRMSGSTSSTTSSSMMPYSKLPVPLQPQLSAALVSSRESSVSTTSGAEGDLHTPKKRKISNSPEITALGPTSNATMHPSLKPMALNTLSPPYMTSTEYPWHASSSGSSVPTTGEETINSASTGSFENCLQQPMLTNDAWIPHADLLEWQALLNQSSITNSTNMAPTTILDGTQLFAEPPLLGPHSQSEYGVLPLLSPTATTSSQQSPTSNIGMTVYRSCEFKDNRGTDDQHLEAIRDAIDCVQSALQWPSCTDSNCLDVCLLDCILALQQCVNCLCAVVSGQHRHERLHQTHRHHSLAHARLKDLDRLTTRARQLMELRGLAEGGSYLLPLLGSLETSSFALNEKLVTLGISAFA